MFKKVKRNFIIVAMASISLVLIVVNVVINVTNYNQQVSTSDQIIEIIEKDNPPVSINNSENPVDPKVGDSRYFTIKFNKELSMIDCNLDHVDKSLINEETAKNYGLEIINNKVERGYKDIYRFHLTNNIGNEYKIVFLDCQRSMENYKNYFQITLFSSLGALVVCFLIIFFGSKFILKPVKESYEKQNRFITNASHELKTPLTIISANNELIELKKGNSEYTKTIDKQVNRMNNMIKNLIDLSKLNENKKLEYENINISKILLDEIKDFRNVCIENKLKLKVHIGKNINIVTNKEYVKKIIPIVLDNARKYSKSTIEIYLFYSKNNVVFKEINDSNNIEEGDLIKYAERFYRHDNIRSKKDGSGIGLSLLEELVLQIKGKLKIYGESGKYNLEITFSNKNKI